MRIILDTNVFISGIFFSGPPSKILKAWANQRFQIVLSQQILDEYQRVAEELSSKFQTIDILPIIELVTIHGQFVDTQGFDISVSEDPDDDKFLECAVVSKCKTIISGDKHLLELSGYEGVTVWSPRNSVYIETTVESYLAARPSRDLIAAAHQQVTVECWENALPKLEPFVSPLVIEEASRGDESASKLRLDKIA
ncbi:MAG: putative toxin-antitoxin system toxin component, PIN family [Deltaproteobacteria bacterium]|nr:putative toxin-antitoxin system toxin component, PIN family [Deltaproteobacteria bacterium]MBW1994271.1 putative toxin-antitoxin system toxin component, PIN family [Deltaproteobacteria bacterium]MBW2154771.1 putative toxin-antitoxin system toxin component, PIN family [Deltaproteobacteria bacterium]